MRHLLTLAALLALTGVAQAHHFAGFRAGFYGGHAFTAQSFYGGYGYSALVVPSVPLVAAYAAPVVQPVVAAPVAQPAPVVQAVAAPPVVAAVATPGYAYGAVSAVAVAPVVVRHRAFLGRAHRAAVVVRSPVVVRRPAVVIRTRAIRVRH